jgi:hypothetical protein
MAHSTLDTSCVVALVALMRWSWMAECLCSQGWREETHPKLILSDWYEKAALSEKSRFSYGLEDHESTKNGGTERFSMPFLASCQPAFPAARETGPTSPLPRRSQPGGFAITCSDAFVVVVAKLGDLCDTALGTYDAEQTRELALQRSLACFRRSN